MPVPFETYKKINSNYCFLYYGNSIEYVVLLSYILPFIKEKYKNINIFMTVRDDHKKFSTYPDTIARSQYNMYNSYFGYVYQITTDLKSNKHPIEKIIDDSEIELPVITPKETTKKMVLITKGTLPTKNLSENQIQLIKQIHQEYDISINNNIKGAGLVVGIESPELFMAGLSGTRTKLIPTGIGTALYKKLFKNNEILSFE